MKSQLEERVGKIMSVWSGGQSIHGTIVSVKDDILELQLDAGAAFISIPLIFAVVEEDEEAKNQIGIGLTHRSDNE